MENLMRFDVTNERNLTMLVDFYELTMANGYFNKEVQNRIAYFDMYFRRVPDGGGYCIMAGVDQLIQYLNNLSFTEGDIKYLEEKNIGFDVGVCKVPIVTGAVLFDLAVGDYKVRPDKEMGYKACLNASETELKQGNYGAGCGATVGKVKGLDYVTKGGIGSYSIKLDNGIVVSALIAVNAFGDVYEDGQVIAGVLNDDKNELLNTYEMMKQGVMKGGFSIDNTTIGVVATNAKLTKAQCKKISQMSHDGYAKAIFPIHTPHDGDTIFTMSTGEIEVESDLTLLGSLATEVVEKSIINAIKNAKSIQNIVSYKELQESK